MKANAVPANTRHAMNTLLVGWCVVVWLWSSWRSHEFSTWLIEQVATVLALVLLFWLCRLVRFSLASKLCVVAMLTIHTVGTHYTYSLTPYNVWSEYLFGSTLNSWFGWERNHYDRFVHFSYGVLLALPIVEAVRVKLRVAGRAAIFIMVQIVLATSALYELMEWGAAVVFGGEVGMAYLGTQGDPWDAQADIALAGLGSLLAVMILRSKGAGASCKRLPAV